MLLGTLKQRKEIFIFGLKIVFVVYISNLYVQPSLRNWKMAPDYDD